MHGFSGQFRTTHRTFALVGIATFFGVAATAFAQQPQQVLSGAVPIAKTVEVQAGPGRYRESTDKALPEPNHPPIDQISPIPFPSDQPVPRGRPGARGARGGIRYDMSNGKIERILRLKDADVRETSREEGYRGADGGESEDGEPGNRFSGNMIAITNPQAYPHRVNVKLVYRFPSDPSRWWVCSGTMIDAETVLTAGHCVYNHNLGGWASEMWVYPAWDGNGNGNPFPADAQHFGRCWGTHLIVNGAWFYDADYGYDVGAIEVTRAAGVLTGWHGYGYSSSCSWNTSTPYYNFSYPAEAPCHNGRTMHHWYGFFDSCSGNSLVIDTSPGCLSAIWGGMSGGGAYYIENDNRYVTSVCSTSDRAYQATYARIDDVSFGWIEEEINKSRGSSFDLQALEARATQSTIPAGGTINSLEHIATNPTNGTTGNRTVSFGVYLSTNNNISSSDTLLSRQSFASAWTAMKTFRLSQAPFTIPSNTRPGDYYLGVLYDSSTDGNSGNNATMSWDAYPIRILAAPQLPPVITSPLAATGTVGNTLSYSITATNNPTSFNATSLPPGLTINTSTGIVSGTPTAVGSWSVQLSASNSGGTGTATATFTINSLMPQVPVINSDLTANGTVGNPFAYSITASNSPTSFNATNLPPGLSVNSSTGLISGLPTTSGFWNVTISATNVGGTGFAVLQVIVTSPAQPPVITSTLTTSGTVGVSYSYRITATNSPSSFNATNLPPGLTVDTTTGEIYGVPSMAGLWHVTISATNPQGTDSKVLVFNVYAAPCDCVVECLFRKNIDAGQRAFEQLLPFIDVPLPIDSLMGSLRTFRDKTLQQMPDGQRMIRAYYDHSDELQRLLRDRPDRISRFVGLITELYPELEKTHKIGALNLTSDQWRRGRRLLSELHPEASAEFKTELEFLQDYLQDIAVDHGSHVLLKFDSVNDAITSTVNSEERRPKSGSLALGGVSMLIVMAGAWLIRRQRGAIRYPT